ncbi:MAG TPA: protease modulator HflK [Candidatus Binatia bacterium]|nr:protease modulator HflK [Candidatus Binatia bacterium]
MSEHDHHDHSHTPPAPDTQDAGSQALSEALRSSFVIVKFAMVALILAILGAGFFTVGPQEKAVILRFGKPVGVGQKMLLGAGLHWSLPYPIDEVVHIPIAEIQKVTTTIGWYHTTPEQELAGTEPPPGPSLNPMVDGYVITADRNIIHARATVSYHIDDPRTAIFNFTSGTNHEFNIAGISNAVLNVANNTLILAAAHFNVDDILTRNFAGFQDAVHQRIAELVDQEHLGVSIDQCQVECIPPRQLKDIFDKVTTARQNYDKLINDAKSKENQILSEAGAQATSITNAAESARIRFVTGVESDAEAFTKLLPRYKENPNLFAQMEVAKAMSQILTNVQEKMFLPERGDGKPRELRLLLNREPPGPKSGANP